MKDLEKAMRQRSFISPLALCAALAAPPALAQDPQGFVISLNGEAIAGDPVVADAVRQTDVALANADIQVVFDGLGATPRLDLEVVGGQPAGPGDTVTLQSALNYPVFVERGELRIIDLASGRTLATSPIAPNGQASLTLPDGEDLAVTHRVYDSAGRFDETAPLRLGVRDQRRRIDGVEDGADQMARRAIPVTGGAVTVTGTDVAPGARVVALGEEIRPDPTGGFVIQRILPAGTYGVDVSVAGAGQSVNLTRDITIPRSEWFYVGTADLTFGRREDGATGETERYSTGRIAGFVDGKTDTGVRITGSIDTREGPIDEMFDRVQDRDPRQLLLRVDPADLYPTYGDDSTIEDVTPTSGLLFLRIEREGNFVQWGDFDASLGDNAFVQNDRTLYGLSAGLTSRQTTPLGEPRASAGLYAAQPDQVPQRDIFLGTGGSTFFLDKQDIAAGTEVLSIQLRDPDTGRIIESRQLVPGEDYAINYIQGVVTLTRPLSSRAAEGLFDIGSARDAEVVLVAAYEHTPLAGDIDGFAYGARAEGWATDTLRFGLSGMRDETGVTDHTVIGADVLFALSDDTFVRLDYARSEGTGFDGTFSADGGLIVSDVISGGSEGEAIKVEGEASLADLGLAADGRIGAYFEQRSEGFSSLDISVTERTGDETFWGLAADVSLTDRVSLLAGFDRYENGAGEERTDGTLQVEYQASPQLAYAIGLEAQDNTGGADPGSRTDLAARLTYTPDDSRSIYVFGQTTLDRDGLPQNDRYGIGGEVAFASGWTLGAELSDGSLGVGGRLTARQDDGNGNTRYVGYEVDPGRDLDGIALSGRDRGRLIFGGTQRIGSTVDLFGENTYDLFGRHRSLTSAYGLTYAASDALSVTTALEFGRVEDGAEYDFERQALTVGVLYEDSQLTAAGRLEYRVEDGLRDGVEVETDTLLLSANAAYRIDDVQRVVFSADVARSESDSAALVDGNYADVVLGYAYRPVEDDRFNLLARYRYLYDLYGLRDADEEDGPRQRSHVFSVDASYDLDTQWTIGGKLGYRIAETATDSEAPFVSNDAWLAVASARWHAVREWDALLELRHLDLVDAGTSETSALGAVYRHLGDNLKIGVGYNFGTFSDDLTDLTFDDRGAFVNLVAQF